MIQLCRILPAVLLLCLSSLAQAEFTEYDIEIIIFEDTTNAFINSEQWPKIDPQADRFSYDHAGNASTAEQPAGEQNKDLTNITINDKTVLDKYVHELKKSQQYNVLVHKAWRQAGLSADSAINIAINSEPPEPIATNETGLPAVHGQPDEIQSPAPSTIKGNIKVVLGRYLHLYTDLIYNRSGTQLASVVPAGQPEQTTWFHIQSHRKMRSKELHYIDHPLVGILIMALPVEKQEDQAQPGNDRQS